MLSEAMNSITGKNVVKWAFESEQKLQDTLRRLALQVALEQAYRAFARTYPRWADSLFDRHFVRREVAEAVWRAVQDGGQPAPAELALAWLSQFGPVEAERLKYRLPEVTPIAADFLAYLDRELRYYPHTPRLLEMTAEPCTSC